MTEHPADQALHDLDMSARRDPAQRIKAVLLAHRAVHGLEAQDLDDDDVRRGAADWITESGSSFVGKRSDTVRVPLVHVTWGEKAYWLQGLPCLTCESAPPWWALILKILPSRSPGRVSASALLQSRR